MNILRYKQKVQGWMPRDDGGGDSSSDSAGFGPPLSAQNYNNSDASAYGGRESGFAPDSGVSPEYSGNGSGWGGESTGFAVAPVAASPVAEVSNAPDQFSRLQELSDMFKANQQLPGVDNSLNQLTNMNFGLGSMPSQSPDSNSPEVNSEMSKRLGFANTYGESNPSMMTRLGIVPGMSQEAFFNQNTPAKQADRMGIVGDTIGGVGQAFLGAAIPAPVRMAMGAYGAYNNYQNDPNRNLGKAVATGLSGVPGYTGALANMYNGNYGSAVSGGLAKNGITGNINTMAGLGTDYATGRNVAPALGGLAGQFTGSALGGPIGGMFGKSLGQFMSKSSSIRK